MILNFKCRNAQSGTNFFRHVASDGVSRSFFSAIYNLSYLNTQLLKTVIVSFTLPHNSLSLIIFLYRNPLIFAIIFSQSWKSFNGTGNWPFQCTYNERDCKLTVKYDIGDTFVKKTLNFQFSILPPDFIEFLEFSSQTIKSGQKFDQGCIDISYLH